MHIEHVPQRRKKERTVAYTKAGPCKITKLDGTVTIIPPLDKNEYRQQVKPGKAEKQIEDHNDRVDRTFAKCR